MASGHGPGCKIFIASSLLLSLCLFLLHFHFDKCGLSVGPFQLKAFKGWQPFAHMPSLALFPPIIIIINILARNTFIHPNEWCVWENGSEWRLTQWRKMAKRKLKFVFCSDPMMCACMCACEMCAHVP